MPRILNKCKSNEVLACVHIILSLKCRVVLAALQDEDLFLHEQPSSSTIP